MQTESPDAAFDPAMIVTLLDLLPNLFFYVHDYDMRLVYVNKAAADQFRKKKDDVVGRHAEEIGELPEHDIHFPNVCQRIMNSGQPHVTDKPIASRLPDGRTVYYRRHDIPFLHPVTGQKMLMGIALDATHEVEHQRQREQLAALDREMEIARSIQTSLRPRELGLGWLDLAGLSTPATAAGGDFYDWSMCEDSGAGRAVTLAIGDVTGHGVGPALLAAAARASWRALAPTLGLREAVLRLHELLSPDLTNGRFITLATVRIYESGRVQLFSAGHGPMLIRRASGQVESYGSQVPPLGVMEEVAGKRAIELELELGDALVLISDGVVELRNASEEEYGEERIAKVLAGPVRTGGGVARQLVEAIEEANVAFAGGRVGGDDRTIVVAGRVMG